MRAQLAVLHIVTAILGFSTTALILPAGPAEAASRPALPSFCEGYTAKAAVPDVLLLGEAVTVTLSFNAVCTGVSSPLHIVLVLDGSAGMAREPHRNMRDALETVISGLELPDNPTTKVGVVEFNTSARTVCRLMNDEEGLRECIGNVDTTGGAAIDRGIIEGLLLLRAGRAGIDPRAKPNDVMILVSEGRNDEGGNPVRAAARRAKSDGVLLITVCASRGCDEPRMREWATSTRYFFKADDAYRIVAIFDKIRQNLTQISIRRLTVVDTIPPNMELVDGSIDPPADVSADRKTLTWALQTVPRSGVTVTFQLRPLEVGYQPTNLSAIGDFTDNQNRKGSVTFPVPFIFAFRAAPAPFSAP